MVSERDEKMEFWVDCVHSFFSLSRDFSVSYYFSSVIIPSVTFLANKVIIIHITHIYINKHEDKDEGGVIYSTD